MLGGGQEAMENGSNSFFPCSWDGEDMKWSSLQGPTCSEGRSRGAAGPALDLLRGGSRGGVGVCAGGGAQQGGVPDPSTLPSKLM